MTTFWLGVAATLLPVFIFETELYEPGLLASGEPTPSEIIITYMAELTTIALIPVSLRLFKFQHIANDLRRRHEAALLHWGALRLILLEGLMLANTVLYYLFMNTSFAYLAIMTALCLPFVYPSEGKCLYEACLTEEYTQEQAEYEREEVGQ